MTAIVILSATVMLTTCGMCGAIVALLRMADSHGRDIECLQRQIDDLQSTRRASAAIVPLRRAA